jgi:hypothetical protein
MKACRNLFGLGILVVVAAAGVGAAAGCSDDYENRTILPEEGGPPRESGAGGDTAPSATCPSLDPVDESRLGWKPPAPTQEGKCQADDLQAMRDYLITNPSATNEDFRNFVKNRDTTCHDCVFADTKNLQWPPAPTLDGKVVTFNVGACYALVTGKQSCGQAVQHGWDCSFEACLQCTSAGELQSCRTNARNTVCKPYEDKAKAECVGTVNVDQVCGTPFDSIRIQCVTANPDAGR